MSGQIVGTVWHIDGEWQHGYGCRSDAGRVKWTMSYGLGLHGMLTKQTSLKMAGTPRECDVIFIGVTTVQKVGGDEARPEGPKLEARMAESGGGVLGKGAASSLPTS